MAQNIPGGIRDDLLFVESYFPAIGLLSTIPEMIKYGEKLLEIYHETNIEKSGKVHIVKRSFLLCQCFFSQYFHNQNLSFFEILKFSSRI